MLPRQEPVLELIPPLGLPITTHTLAHVANKKGSTTGTPPRGKDNVRSVRNGTTQDSRVVPGVAQNTVMVEPSLAIPPKDNVCNKVLAHHRQGPLLIGAADVASARGKDPVRRVGNIRQRCHNRGRDYRPKKLSFPGVKMSCGPVQARPSWYRNV